MRSLTVVLAVSCGAILAQESPTFESKVNLVVVPVVVRDAEGHTIGALTKGDFTLFDKGKRQTISGFSLIHNAGATPRQSENESATFETRSSVESQRTSGQQRPTSPAPSPRYCIYVFDDLNTDFSDTDALRSAAVRHFEHDFLSPIAPPSRRSPVAQHSISPIHGDLRITTLTRPISVPRTRLADTRAGLETRPARAR